MNVPSHMVDAIKECPPFFKLWVQTSIADNGDKKASGGDAWITWNAEKITGWFVDDAFWEHLNYDTSKINKHSSKSMSNSPLPGRGIIIESVF